MRMLVIAAALVLAGLSTGSLIACDPAPPEQGTDAGDDNCAGTERSFGQCCDSGANCASGICHEFGDGTKACTEACQSASECPVGSQGQKCNNQNVCRV